MSLCRAHVLLVLVGRIPVNQSTVVNILSWNGGLDVAQFKLSQLLQDNSYRCSAAAEMGDRLATIGMGRKMAAAFPPFGRSSVLI